jgi:hypothetical protein
MLLYKKEKLLNSDHLQYQQHDKTAHEEQQSLQYSVVLQMQLGMMHLFVLLYYYYWLQLLYLRVGR